MASDISSASSPLVYPSVNSSSPSAPQQSLIMTFMSRRSWHIERNTFTNSLRTSATAGPTGASASVHSFHSSPPPHFCLALTQAAQAFPRPLPLTQMILLIRHLASNEWKDPNKRHHTHRWHGTS